MHSCAEHPHHEALITVHRIGVTQSMKLKEISYIHAEGYSAGDMKPGPIALLNARVPGTVFNKVLSNAQEAKARDAQLIGFAPECADAELFDTLFPCLWWMSC